MNMYDRVKQIVKLGYSESLEDVLRDTNNLLDTIEKDDEILEELFHIKLRNDYAHTQNVYMIYGHRFTPGHILKNCLSPEEYEAAFTKWKKEDFNPKDLHPINIVKTLLETKKNLETLLGKEEKGK